MDMTEKMTSLGLAKYFPSDAWPPHNAVRETATKIRSRVKQGEEKPFVFADLRKRASFVRWLCFFYMCLRFRFVPPFCHGFIPVQLDGEKSEGGRKEFARRMEPTIWLIAWESYALRAAVLGQVAHVRL